MKKQILRIILEVVEEVNKTLEKKIPIKKGANAPLFGEIGVLDSLGLVNILVAIEQNIEDEFDVIITIADERAMSQKHSPFKTIGTLAEYLYILLKEMEGSAGFQPNPNKP